MKLLWILIIGMTLGGMWVQYRISGTIWGKPECVEWRGND